MIIDRVQAAGAEAYLLDTGQVDLSQSASGSGQTATIPEGVALDVSSIRLYLEAADLAALYPHRGFDSKPLISIEVVKEMFPDLFADPYSNRVHTIAGYDDLNRGELKNMRVMEVDGQATLVSLDRGGCGYQSPLYEMYRPMQLEHAAWDLATSRLTPSDGFSYKLSLRYWVAGEDPAADPGHLRTLTPGGGASPVDLRKVENLGLKNVIAYRAVFKATVKFDTFLKEYSERPDPRETYGRPLLRKLHLLERVPSPYAIQSLLELEARCGDFTILTPAEPLTRLSADVNISALLVQDERIVLRISKDVWKRAEARVIGEVRVRPPKSDKELGG